ncbi:hypothetical protein [Nocardioides sp. YIM 152588]|uniref:hypothetical protein n=1 Tax=Nocardioides sp. YIM 152588 TaxID=3158259 RepID=UPI0032E44359
MLTLRGVAGVGPGVPRRRRTGVWVAVAAVLALLVGGGVVTAVVLAGDDGGGGKKAEESAVDVTAAALDARYAGLSDHVATGASDCTAGETGDGEAEVVECAVSGGTLRLVTYSSPEALAAVRDARLDTRAGMLSGRTGSRAFYEFDPDNAASDDPALVYWDDAAGPQSAELTGADGATLETLVTVFTGTGPRITEPTEPSHPVLREFIEITMDPADCRRGTTYADGETEESVCTVRDDISVVVGRYASRRDLRGVRRYYQRTWREADDRNPNDYWRFGEGAKEGAHFNYQEGADTSILYWDWNKRTCNCYAVAFGYDVGWDVLRQWWENAG